MAARRPGFARMRWANLDCNWNSRDHPRTCRSSVRRPAVSRPCWMRWMPNGSAIKLGLSFFAPKAERAIVSLIASHCSPESYPPALHDDPAGAQKSFGRSGQYRVLPAPAALKTTSARISSFYSPGCGYSQNPPSRR